MTEHEPAAISGLPIKLCVYISRPAPGLSLYDVHALLFDARSHNAINGIFGLLTYDRRGFLQVLEGVGSAVDELLVRIMADTRHHDITVLHVADDPPPRFASFSDLLCAGDERASIDRLLPSTRAKLTPDLAAIIEQGYMLLDTAP